MSLVPPDSLEKIHRVFEQMSIQGKILVSPPTGRGGNNRSFVVSIGNDRFFVKEYAKHHLDTRDRLGTEFSFLRFLTNRGITSVPVPLFSSSEEGIAVYSHIEGEPFTTSITEKEVVKAAEFFTAINKFATDSEALKLPDGSDSVFSVNEQCKRVQARIERLINIESSEIIDIDCRDFAASTLTKLYDSIYEVICNSCENESISLEMLLPQSQRCLSPSDFGFHNVLLGNDGVLYFVDFEYAGWDDPARTIGDFFSQPKVPVPLEYWNMFFSKAFSYLEDSKIHETRAKILFPIHRLKWICIILNPFVADGAHRTSFARADTKDTIKEERLQRAKMSVSHDFHLIFDR